MMRKKKRVLEHVNEETSSIQWQCVGWLGGKRQNRIKMRKDMGTQRKNGCQYRVSKICFHVQKRTNEEVAFKQNEKLLKEKYPAI